MLASPHPSLRLADIRFRRRRDLHDFYSPGHLRLTYNARSAFYQLLCSLSAGKRRIVLLPAFHCTALVEPVPRAGFDVEFYRVFPDLSPDMDDVRQKVSEHVAAVVAVHYFGFATDLEPFLELRRAFGCLLIEDCAHSFLSESGGSPIGHRGDFSLFSFYKFAPGLAGGGLGINGLQAAHFPGALKISWKEAIVLAKRLLEQMLENSPQGFAARVVLALEKFRVSYRRSRPAATPYSTLVDDPYLFREDLALSQMPYLCRRILELTDWEDNVAARRRNYMILSEEIADVPGAIKVFPTLAPGVCPWAFPVLLEDRIAHEEHLRAAGVPLFTFGEVLHPLLLRQNGETLRSAQYLSKRLLLLPVHAQLDEATAREMARRFGAYARAVSERGDNSGSVGWNVSPGEKR